MSKRKTGFKKVDKVQRFGGYQVLDLCSEEDEFSLRVDGHSVLSEYGHSRYKSAGFRKQIAVLRAALDEAEKWADYQDTVDR